MPDLAAAYHDARLSMSELARNVKDVDARVPACPDWTVRDLVAHVTSIASELCAGHIPADLNLVQIWDEDTARRREEFIAGELEARSKMNIPELLEEWERSGTLLEEMLRGERPMPHQAPPLVEWIVVTDVGVHLNDLRGALGLPGDGESLAVGLSLRSYVEGMRMQSAMKHLPPFRIRAGSREWVIGHGEPVATLTGDPFELNRVASGRRSPDQVRKLDWEGDPEPFIDLFYPYGLREDALVE